MCTIIFAHRAHPNYDLIFLGNRDEFKARPSQPARFWADAPQVLAGMDLDKRGTWTGVTRSGRIAFVTNHRDPALQKQETQSRGDLTKDFLIGRMGPEAYVEDLRSKRAQYNPYNLVVGDSGSLWFYSNVVDVPRQLAPGVYGLSNGTLDSPWPKVEQARSALLSLMAREVILPEDLFPILSDTQRPPDECLPSTGVPLETERLLASMYIESETYGTLFQTVILADKAGGLCFRERFRNGADHWEEQRFDFQWADEGQG